jgi:hypothetical protein
VLGDLQDTLTALLDLRVCIGVCRVNFLLCALPQTLLKDAADVFDDLMQVTFASIACTVLSDKAGLRLSRPLRHPSVRDLG